MFVNAKPLKVYPSREFTIEGKLYRVQRVDARIGYRVKVYTVRGHWAKTTSPRIRAMAIESYKCMVPE